MIGRTIRALAELPFSAGDWLIQRSWSPLAGELMPSMPSQAEIDAAIREAVGER
jgi:hypothetical protein